MCECPQDFLVNRQLCAEFQRVTPKTIIEWAKDGMPVHTVRKGKNGNLYCLRCVSEWRADYLLESGQLDYTAERARLAKLQADRIEHELKVTNQEYVALEYADCAWTKLTLACRSRLLNMPTKLAPLMVGHTKPNEPCEILTTAVYEALTELSSRGAKTMGEFIDRKDVTEIFNNINDKLDALRTELAEKFAPLFLDMPHEEVSEMWQQFVSERMDEINEEAVAEIKKKSFPVGDWQ